MNSVIFIPEVRQYFKDLVPILYEKGYFSFEDTAHKYVNELIEDIRVNLPAKFKREAPEYFTGRYGEGLYYAVFPKSRRTHWYAFFRMYQENSKLFYQVRFIANNHTIAQHL
ncbi:hypothetical protein FACS189451_00900 [Bacteroidia bacterium]|nr:hypothetical protein FACS189446_2940 [Bacteroidia bacterium]GHT60584.1 hypothetical protein FACS189451_00900 [Bacteroidia bacterium]